MHLLIVEDDLSLGQTLSQALLLEGMTVEWVRTAQQAVAFAPANQYDCILLDLSLPDGQGIDLLKHWRAQALNYPIIIISAQSALETRLEGLDSGADDYILKPFATVELLSRIHAVVRRSVRQADDVWKIGKLSIVPKKQQVYLNDQQLTLTQREFMILQVLAQQAGDVISKNKLAEKLVPMGEAVDFGTLEVHMSNLRKKIGADKISTVRGVGYCLKVPST